MRCRPHIHRRIPKEHETESKVQVVDMFMDSKAATITMEIGHHYEIGVQLDGGKANDIASNGRVGSKNFGSKTMVARLEFHVTYLIV